MMKWTTVTMTTHPAYEDISVMSVQESDFV